MKKIFLSLLIAMFAVVNVNAQNSASIYKKSNIFLRNNAVSIGMTIGMTETQCLFDNEREGGCSNPLLGANAKIYGVIFNIGTYLNHSSSVSLDYFENEDK